LTSTHLVSHGTLRSTQYAPDGPPRVPTRLTPLQRGLVPAIKFNDQIITESGVVSQFLADAYPSDFLPASNTVEGALARARINFFVDTWFSKVGSYWFQILMKEADDEKEALAKELVEKVGKEIEPLLKDAAPFFGGSSKVTLAEALTAPFILRIYSLANNDLLPKSILSGFEGLPNFSKWATHVLKQESVTYIWDEAAVLPATKKKIESLRAQAK
jgi:glutathione S-transferase